MLQLFRNATKSLTSAKSGKMPVLVGLSFFCIRSEGETP